MPAPDFKDENNEQGQDLTIDELQESQTETESTHAPNKAGLPKPEHVPQEDAKL